MKKTIIIILALMMPLAAQDSTNPDPKRKEMVVEKRKKMAKKQKIKSMVRLAVVAGVAYYVGYHEGEKHFKPQMRRRFPMGDKK